MQDRKYVDALVEQYLTPRHRQTTRKMNMSEKQTKFPRIRKGTESSFKITEVRTTTENPSIKPSKDREVTQLKKEELASRAVTQLKKEELASTEVTKSQK